jgi:phosphosulfolactate synthase
VSGARESFLLTPGRESKPRRWGVTHALDPAMPTDLLAAYLDSAGTFIDIVKTGWGLGYVDPHLTRRADLCRSHGVLLSTGGTLLEIAAHQGRLERFADWAEARGVTAIEVSNGLGLLSIAEKAKIIAGLNGRFVVLAETGSKDEHVTLSPAQWATEMTSDLESGATWAIAEGRESGTVGIYQTDGSVRSEIFDAIAERVGAEHVIFEAPRKSQQAWLLRQLGPAANLGNIRVEDALGVETLRLGLRADTFARPAVEPQVVQQCGVEG